MTFIEMVRAVRSRVGMQGNTPSSISGAVGAEIDLVNAVKDAWIDIQNSRDDWKWQRASKQFYTVVDDFDYDVDEILPVVHTAFDRWRDDSTYYINADNKRVPVRYVGYDYYNRSNIDSEVSNSPRVFTVRPWDNTVLINPPDQIYTMYIGYQKSLQDLSGDADVPDMPAHFHMLIVYKAIEKFTVGIGAPELYNKYAQEYVTLWGTLTRSQLPEKHFKHTGGIA